MALLRDAFTGEDGRARSRLIGTNSALDKTTHGLAGTFSSGALIRLILRTNWLVSMHS